MPATPRRRRPGPAWIVYPVSALHVLWGVTVLLDVAVLRVTGISLVYQILQSRPLVAATFAASGLLAVCGYHVLSRTCGGRWRAIIGAAMLLPQQALLWLSAIRGMAAAAAGQSADGTLRPPVFIADDQLIYLVVAIIYTIAVIEFHGETMVVDRGAD